MSDSEIKAPSLDQLYSRHSSKWRRYPSDVLPMHVAEMDFQIAQPVQDRLIKMVQDSDLGYLGPVPEVASAFAKFADARWAWKVDQSQVRLVTDVGVAVVEFLRAQGAHGSKVIINSPVYHGFWHWLDELEIAQVDVPLLADYSLDIDGIERQFAAGVKYVLLCNPQNPIGKAFTREELTALAEAAKRHGAIIISDEIHAPLTYTDSTFVPFLTCGEAAEAVGVCITSSSKSWNLAGLKAAITVTQSDVMNSAVSKMPEAAHWRSSILGAFAMAECFENGTLWLDSTVATLDENRKFLKSELERLLPTVKYQLPQASYLAWLDVSELGLGEETAATLIRDAKVALVPGNEHGPQYTDFVRLNFGTSRENITEGLSRIANFFAVSR